MPKAERERTPSPKRERYWVCVRDLRDESDPFSSCAQIKVVPADRLSRVEGAMVEAVLPLEVIAGQHRVKPYRELSPELIEQINASIEAVRAALPHPEDTEGTNRRLWGHSCPHRQSRRFRRNASSSDRERARSRDSQLLPSHKALPRLPTSPRAGRIVSGERGSVRRALLVPLGAMVFGVINFALGLALELFPLLIVGVSVYVLGAREALVRAINAPDPGRRDG